jgi:hypothetical protein
MKYLHKPNFHDLRGSEPRFLNEEEITLLSNKIIKERPLVVSNRVLELSNKYLEIHIRDQVSRDKICPEAIPRFIDIAVNHYKITKIKAGKPIGSSITEYYMASTMQKTLDFFHNSSASVKTGYAEVSEIIRVPEKRKEENIYVHFKRDRKVNHNFILGLKKEFTTIYLSTIIKNYAVGSSESMRDTYADEWWYNSQLKMNKLEKKSTTVMRLEFDVSQLYIYKIAMETIVSVILGSSYIKDENKNFVSAIYLIVSPLHLGIIDIYPKDDIIVDRVGIEKENSENALRYVYSSFIYDHFKTIVISGLGGKKKNDEVGNVIPMEFQYNTILLDSVKQDDGTYILMKRNNLIMFEGIDYNKVRKYLGFFGVGYKDNDDKTITVTMPEGIDIDLSEYLLNINKIVETLFDQDVIKKEEDVWGIPLLKSDSCDVDIIGLGGFEETMKYVYAMLKVTLKKTYFKINTKSDYTPIEFLKYKTNYYYAIVKSSNLKDILLNENVDRTRTYSNNFKNMAEVFGILAAKNYYIYNSHQIMGDSANSRFIQILSAYVTSLGYFAGVSFGKSAGHGVGVFTRATREQTFKVLSENAFSGSSEKGGNISVCTALGTLAKVGNEYNIDYSSRYENITTETHDSQIESLLDNIKEGKLDKLQMKKTKVNIVNELTETLTFPAGFTKSIFNIFDIICDI